MKKITERIVEKNCPLCRNTNYMIVEEENYKTIMEYMDGTERKSIQEALSFLNAFGREFILTGYCPKCQKILFAAKQKKQDKENYFSCKDLDNKALRKFLDIARRDGIVSAISSDKAKALSRPQKLFVVDKYNLWEEVQLDDSNNLVLTESGKDGATDEH